MKIKEEWENITYIYIIINIQIIIKKGEWETFNINQLNINYIIKSYIKYN